MCSYAYKEEQQIVIYCYWCFPHWGTAMGWFTISSLNAANMILFYSPFPFRKLFNTLYLIMLCWCRGPHWFCNISASTWLFHLPPCDDTVCVCGWKWSSAFRSTWTCPLQCSLMLSMSCCTVVMALYFLFSLLKSPLGRIILYNSSVVSL